MTFNRPTIVFKSEEKNDKQKKEFTLQISVLNR